MTDLPQPWPDALQALEHADIRGSLPAMRRAAASARAHAIRTQTGIVVRRDGRPVFVSYEELQQQDASTSEQTLAK